MLLAPIVPPHSSVREERSATVVCKTAPRNIQNLVEAVDVSRADIRPSARLRHRDMRSSLRSSASRSRCLWHRIPRLSPTYGSRTPSQRVTKVQMNLWCLLRLFVVLSSLCDVQLRSRGVFSSCCKGKANFTLTHPA